MAAKEVFGEDGQCRCPVCGGVTRRSVVLFGQELHLRFMCKCREAEKAREKEQEKFQADMETVRKLKKLPLMDARLADASFSNYAVDAGNQKAYIAATRYVERFGDMLENGQGILFYGPVGTGKSYTAAAIANELMNRKRSAVMTSFVKLLEKLSAFDTDDEEYIARLNHADLLFIDDLGAERSTDTALSKVYNIVYSRYRSRKPLILTTNLEMRQIKNETDIRYVRIYDRIVEMCYPIRMDGLSRRKREAVRRYDAMKQLLEG